MLAGALDELRAAVSERFVEIRYAGTPPDWSTLRGWDVVESTDGHARLRVDRNVDVGPVLTLTRQHADLVSFSYEPPTLSELFRQAVAA